jgi:hypothetical protein
MALSPPLGRSCSLSGRGAFGLRPSLGLLERVVAKQAAAAVPPCHQSEARLSPTLTRVLAVVQVLVLVLSLALVLLSRYAVPPPPTVFPGSSLALLARRPLDDAAISAAIATPLPG